MIDRALRIMERRSKLLGLDAPMKQDLRVTDRLDAQIEQLAAELLTLEEHTDDYTIPYANASGRARTIWPW